ncbi:13827_t:CDS:1 [Acaulospora morrowiae]|uniref:13827_t:CDS:1 n=1 Tax=Acaulospora morrowiae TaxID=94023 RepID=A0A9N9A7X1_9GLOM|nr:13827_t:CDS:1 [Acaulospora morrowiae]
MLHQYPFLQFRRQMRLNPPILRKDSAFDITLRNAKSSIYVFLKYFLIGLVVITCSFYIAYRGFHFYIEHYLHPTPKVLSTKARDCLRGAYFREEMVPDSSRAEVFLMRAMEFAFEQGLGVDDPVIIDIWLRLAYNHIWSGKLDEAISVYRSVLEKLMKSGKEENLKRSINVAKKIGDLYIRMQELDIAEKYLNWAIEMLQGDRDQLIKRSPNFVDEHPARSLTITNKIFEGSGSINKELVGCVDSLAGLYAQQKKHDLALLLYLGMLKMIQSRPKESQEGTHWNCWEAIIMGHLGEVFYGLGKREEALGWMQQGLNMARDGSGIRDCDECAGMILYNLGIIYEKDGKTKVAISLLDQAIEFAEKAQDLKGIDDYTTKLIRLTSQQSDEINEEI